MSDRGDLGSGGGGVGPRWDLWLPVLAGVVAGLLVGSPRWRRGRFPSAIACPLTAA